MKKPADLTIDDILERKARGRKGSSSLSFGEKVQIVEAMRVQADAFRRLRQSKAAGSARRKAT
jgi:hypothetical protein